MLGCFGLLGLELVEALALAALMASIGMRCCGLGRHCEQTVLTDAVKALRQRVHQEAAVEPDSIGAFIGRS